MSYKIYIIECDYLQTSGIVLSTLLDMEETHVATYISDNIICVDTFSNLEEMYRLFVITMDLVIGITELTNENFVEVMGCYNPDSQNKVKEFIKGTEISTDINYFLDLIVDRGGIKHLSLKEYQRLEELSN